MTNNDLTKIQLAVMKTLVDLQDIDLGVKMRYIERFERIFVEDHKYLKSTEIAKGYLNPPDKEHSKSLLGKKL